MKKALTIALAASLLAFGTEPAKADYQYFRSGGYSWSCNTYSTGVSCSEMKKIDEGPTDWVASAEKRIAEAPAQLNKARADKVFPCSSYQSVVTSLKVADDLLVASKRMSSPQLAALMETALSEAESHPKCQVVRLSYGGVIRSR